MERLNDYVKYNYNKKTSQSISTLLYRIHFPLKRLEYEILAHVLCLTLVFPLSCQWTSRSSRLLHPL